MSLTSKRIYEFGEFRLKVSARLLERDGKAVPLGSKAFEVLTCLVMRAGEVVTKDELLKTVWPESFVEEGNLSQHIFTLRKALGDRSAYIVTIPGRGYQFREFVQEMAELPPSPPPSPMPSPPLDPGSFTLQRTRERTHIVIEETSSGGFSQQAESPTGELSLPHPTRHRPVPLWAILTLTGLALFGAWFGLRQLAPKPPPSQRIVLAEFDNLTGDPGFDVVLGNALKIDLDQSPFMDVMGEPEELNTLRLMGRNPETALLPKVAREVCERSNRQVLITGSVASIGQKYLLTLEASDCNSGKALAGAKSEAANKEHALAALDSVSAQLRHGLGESNASLERFQVPIAQATTSSLEALKQYSIGEYLLGKMGKGESEVLPIFKSAAELDPDFAMADVAVATSYYRLGEVELAAPYYQRAFDLSGHVSEKERLYIRAHYYADDMRDVRQGIQAYRTWAEVYPSDWGPWLDLAREYSQLGQYDPAVAAAEHALALDPSRGIVYGVLANEYLHADRYADAESTAARAISIGRDSHMLHVTLFETALLQHNRAAMDRQIAQSSGKEGEWEFLDLQALAAARAGELRHAEELFQAAHDSAMREDLPGKANDILIDQASAEFDLGMVPAARSTLRELNQPSSENPQAYFLEAELGAASPPQQDLPIHGRPTDSDTLMTYVYGPLVRAEAGLHQAKPLQSIAELEPSADYEFTAGFAVIDERAKAYQMARQPEKAAIEYRKILDHPGVDPVSPLLPLAWLGLARAESQAGHIEDSKADYNKLFDQWSQADPDLPVLLAARREYATLTAPRK